MTWDTRYRPLKFGDVLGQSGTVQLLKARLRNGTALNTSYVFSGGHGQGKTTLARIMARAILCQNLNKEDPEPCNVCDNCRDILNESSTAFFERDAASNGTIDKIRAIVDDLPFAVMGAAKRIYLFDEAHRMSRDAQDVLLKPIEDDKMVAMLCTTEVDKIRGTILSRCEPYAIRKVTREDILERMRHVLKTEGVEYEDDAVLTVIDHSGGHVRDVLNRLEMIAQMGTINLSNVREYLHLNNVTHYFDILLAIGDAPKAVALIEEACERAPAEDVSAGLAEAAMNSFRLANGMHADFAYVDKERAQKVWQKWTAQTLPLAEEFLRIRYANRIALACAVVRLSGGVPAYVVPQPAVQPVVTAPPVSQPPAATAVSEVAAKNPAVAPPVQQPVSGQQAAPPPAPEPPKGPTRVGGLGSSDPMALTELDVKAVPSNMPRRPGTVAPPIHFAGKSDEDTELLTPDEWRREFERTWAALSGVQ
jgi:DNA polymerase III subunit gamma/tau